MTKHNTQRRRKSIDLITCQSLETSMEMYCHSQFRFKTLFGCEDQLCTANHQHGRCQCGRRLPSALVNVNTRRTPRWSYSKSIFVSFYPFVDPFHSLSCLAIFSVTLAEWVTTRAAAEWQEVWYHRPGWRGRASHLISQRNQWPRLNSGALLLKHHTRHEQKADRSQLSRAGYIVYIQNDCECYI